MIDTNNTVGAGEAASENTPLLSTGDAAKPGATSYGCSTSPKAEDCRETPFKIKLAFFILGAGADVLWNGIFLSVSYFELFLGPYVLSQLGLAQNLPWLGAMIWLLCFESYTRWPDLRLKMMFTCFGYMLFLSACLLTLIFFRSAPNVWLLYGGILINGAGTGFSQALVGSFAGYFDQYSVSGGVLSLQIAGAGFGCCLPVIIQCIYIPISIGASEDELPEIAAHSALVIQMLCACILLASVWALFAIWDTPEYQKIMATEEEERGKAYTDLGKNYPTPFIHEYPDLGKNRVRQLAQAVTIEFIVVAVGCWMTMLTPHIRPTFASQSPFWNQYLATLLIICFNFAGFGGRLLSSSLTLPSPWLLRAFACCCVGFVGVVLIYCADIPSFLNQFDGVNVGIMAVFVTAAFLQGMSMVWGSEFGQGLIEHSHDKPCPIAGQVIWLAIQAGAVFGITFSFLPVP